MTQDEIVEMARQAGVDMSLGEHWSFFIEELEAFAKLVAEAEREACAKIVEESSLPDTYSEACLLDIANEIRARGQE